MSDRVSFATDSCNDLGIATEHQRRPKKKKQMFDELSQVVEQPCETNLRKEMFSTVYRSIQEMALKYQQVPKVSEKYAFFTPLSLLDDHGDCQIDKITTTLIKRSSWL